MEKEKRKIMVVDDSIENIKILIELLKPHYLVSFATNAEKGLAQVKKMNPDVILLDIMMDQMNGYEMCEILKNDPETADIPVVFVTAISEAMDEAKGFEAGGADYITKPFVPVSTLARVKNQVQISTYVKELKRLNSLALDANPMTQLPGNNTIRKHIENLIAENKEQSILYLDLDNFKHYNDVYGFAKGDSVIQATANLLKKNATAIDSKDIFTGHIGGDDFIVTLESSKAVEFVETFIQGFDEMIKDFYSQKDQEQGYVISKNRNKEIVKAPFVSISIAGVDLQHRDYKNYLEVNDTCAEIKTKVKNTPSSAYLFERRS